MKCKECNKVFNNKIQYERHKNRKNSCSINQLQCKKCEAIFKDRNHYNRHLNRKTPCDLVIDTYDESKERCKYCNRTYHSRSNLIRHLKTCKIKNGGGKILTKRPQAKKRIIETTEKTTVVKTVKTTVIDEDVEENQNKKGFIYLVHVREFIRMKEDVYKIGYTRRDIEQRMNGYPKGSKILFSISVKDAKYVELELIRIFKKKFVQKKDFGSEYFEGNLDNMTKTIIKYIYEFNQDESSSEEDSEEQSDESNSNSEEFEEQTDEVNSEDQTEESSYSYDIEAEESSS